MKDWDDGHRARRNVAVLAAAAAILGAQMPILFLIGGLVGQMSSPIACLATLPITAMTLGSMLSAGPLAGLMQRRGRKTGFLLAAASGCAGALVSAAGVATGSFATICAGGLLSGVYMAGNGLFRFAATDTAPPAFQPKAISLVLAGGLVAAILGPQLVTLTADAFVIPFLGAYLAAAGLNLAAGWLFLLLDIPRPPAPAEGAPRGRTRIELLTTPRIAVAVICAMVAYALMNLMMTSTPLAVVGCGFGTEAAANVVSAHVLAMYVPSFFTGHLIARAGATRITGLGLAILAAAGVAGLSGVALPNFFAALVLLGIGWNFAFIGATSMLAAAHTPEERGRMQGTNDALVFGCVTVASLASGGLMNCAGATPVAGWTAVNLAMIPFLTLAGGALVWLTIRRRLGAV